MGNSWKQLEEQPWWEEDLGLGPITESIQDNLDHEISMHMS